jgi:hypothetical protein
MTPDNPGRGFSSYLQPDTSLSPRAPAVSADRRGGWGDLDTGTIIVAEFISAILTWGGIGWLLDRWLRTEPWLIVLGFVIGTVAGFYLMYLRSHGMLTTAPQPHAASANRPTNQDACSADDANATEHTTKGAPHGSN